MIENRDQVNVEEESDLKNNLWDNPVWPPHFTDEEILTPKR